jgi:hypothetical protein
MTVQAGDVYGEYVVQSVAATGKHKKFLCRCSCGTEKVVFGFSLKNGEAWHCGCKRYEVRSKIWASKSDEQKESWKQKCNNKKHLMHDTKAYQAWCDMRQRCGNKNHKWYLSYGGRGISVCDEWLVSFDAFFRDMGDPPSKKHQLGRIDNDAEYSKENCRWETPSQNQRNKSNTSVVETPLGRMGLCDASDVYGLTPDCIKHRIKVGWDIQRVFSVPSKRSKDRKGYLKPDGTFVKVE